MFIVLSSWLKVIVRVHSVHLMNVVWRQLAANPQTKPVDLGRESACIRLPFATPTIAILLLLSHVVVHDTWRCHRVPSWKTHLASRRPHCLVMLLLECFISVQYFRIYLINCAANMVCWHVNCLRATGLKMWQYKHLLYIQHKLLYVYVCLMSAHNSGNG